MSSCSTVQPIQVFSEGKEKERKGKERKGKERKGKERKGKERKGKERKGKERKRLSASINEKASMIPGCPGAALHY